MTGQRLPGGLPHEVECGLRGHDVDLMTLFGEKTKEGRDLEGRDPSSDTQDDPHARLLGFSL